MPSLAGQQVDKYDVLDEVGHGGMAVVYRARDRVLDREVAVKILHPHLADREESRARLRREAITVAKLRHENIVEIYDYSGPEAAESYIVTEFIHGETLRTWLDERWTPRPALAALVVHRLCLALEHAHGFGVIHRDLKPENVMIRADGCLKLMDFGIAQILDQQKLTMTGQLLGSPAYMAPELISGKPIDARTDIFSLGIILYQLATGKLPFSGRNPHEVLNRIADTQYTPPSEVCALVDDDMERIIDRVLAREPKDRPATAADLAKDLEAYLASLGLEPDVALLRAYFRAPDDMLRDLDGRVRDHLLARARTEAAAGHGAKALRLLGRVLELSPSDAEARALLDEVRQRGRRMRALLLAGGAVAMVGMIAAGVTLMGVPSGAATDGTAVADMGVAEDLPGSTSEIRTVPSERVRPSRGAAGAEKTDGADPAPTRARTRAVVKAASEGRLPPGGKPPPNTGTGETCSISVLGVPATQLGYHQLVVDGRQAKWNAERSEFVVQVSDEVVANLQGPRYSGRTTLSPSSCRSGAIRLTAKPRPATVSLSDLPAGVKTADVLVRCVSGCTRRDFADAFAVTIPGGDDGEHQVEVQLKFSTKDAAWQSEGTYILQAGRNVIEARLDRVGE